MRNTGGMTSSEAPKALQVSDALNARGHSYESELLDLRIQPPIEPKWLQHENGLWALVMKNPYIYAYMYQNINQDCKVEHTMFSPLVVVSKRVVYWNKSIWETKYLSPVSTAPFAFCVAAVIALTPHPRWLWWPQATRHFILAQVPKKRESFTF